MLKTSEPSFPVIGVLLATHNPTPFILEQIESIRNQEQVSTVVYWGDYGSSNETKQYVRDLLKGLKYFEIEIKKPGPAANFFELLRSSSEDYVAFADQDDYWLSGKLINQFNLMKNSSRTPSLAHSNIEKLVGDKRVSRKSICNDHLFSSLAIKNCCQGCTIMINRAAKDVILSTLPDKIIWHDWWIGIVVSITGKIYFAEETEVLYRIHKGNTIGLPNAFQRLRNFLMRSGEPASYQIKEAIERFDQVLGPNSATTRQLQNLISDDWRKRLVANMKAKRTRTNVVAEILHRISWTIRKP